MTYTPLPRGNAGSGPIEHGSSLGELRHVPERAVLVGEQDQVVIPKARFRRPSSNSIIATRPWASGSSGISSVSAQPRRIASAASSPRVQGADNPR